jgi:hypothetical protein
VFFIHRIKLIGVYSFNLTLPKIFHLLQNENASEYQKKDHPNWMVFNIVKLKNYYLESAFLVVFVAGAGVALAGVAAGAGFAASFTAGAAPAFESNTVP